jgi:hypothetical protein
MRLTQPTFSSPLPHHATDCCVGILDRKEPSAPSAPPRTPSGTVSPLGPWTDRVRKETAG